MRGRLHGKTAAFQKAFGRILAIFHDLEGGIEHAGHMLPDLFDRKRQGGESGPVETPKARRRPVRGEKSHPEILNSNT